MQKNIKLLIAYDGSAYFGWQKNNAGPSIEGTLQKALEKIYQAPIILQAASRTDAGVHAFGQVVNFFSARDPANLNKTLNALNRLLPRDIIVKDISQAHPDFHPTLDSTSKEYRYRICNVPYQLPQERFYSWHVYEKLHLDAMQQAAQHFVGQHNFSAFCNYKKNLKYSDYHREISEVTFLNLPDNRFEIRIVGNHFLYKMVRNIVGTLVYVGKGLISADSIPKILSAQDRQQAGITAPAHGLTLHHIHYSGPEAACVLSSNCSF
jgi:tRNA pseudouridine38-40 synthase